MLSSLERTIIVNLEDITKTKGTINEPITYGLKVWHTCTLEYFYANYSVHKGVHHADMSQTKFCKLNQLLFMLF